MLLPYFRDRCVQGWLEVEGWSGAQVPVETEAPMLHGLQLGLEPGQGRLLLAPLSSSPTLKTDDTRTPGLSRKGSHLKIMTFYDLGWGDACGTKLDPHCTPYDRLKLTEWTNLALVNQPQEAVAAHARGMRALLRIDHKSYGICCRDGPVYTYKKKTSTRMAMCPGWKTAAKNLTQSTLLPMMKAGSLAGLMLGDELLLAGMSYANFTAYAGLMRSLLPSDVILYMNFGSSGKHYRKESGGDSDGVWYWPGVPHMIDLCSLDNYGLVNVSQMVYNRTIFPTLQPHQQVLLVPQTALGEQHTAGEAGDRFLTAQLAEYWSWAQADTRVAGFMGWYLLNSTHGTGAEGLPLLLAALEKIGRTIVGGTPQLALKLDDDVTSQMRRDSRAPTSDRRVSSIPSHSLSAELSALAQLYRAGDLEHDEFRFAKRQLLDSPSSTPSVTNQPFSQQVVSIRDFGAVGNNTHDSTASIQAAIDEAQKCGASVFIPSGVYKITAPLNVTAPVYGETASTSVIANHGTGTDAFIVLTGYHTEFHDFKVIGDCEHYNIPGRGLCQTRDGIVLIINKSYMRFNNVHSAFHGRHGLHQRADWATSWTNCQFSYNRGLGIFLDAIKGDPGVSNGVSFIGCESRWNGGPLVFGGCVNCTNATHASDRGGVKLIGAAMVQFIGGVYESNEPWGFVIDSPYFATRAVTITGIYTEGNGNNAMVGGAFYIGHAVSSVKILNSWLGASPCGSCPNGSKNFLFANNGSYDSVGGYALGSAELIEKDNFKICTGSTPEHSCELYYGVSNTPSVELTSRIFGDSGASGSSTVVDLLAVSDDAVFLVAGTVHLSRTGEMAGFSGSYPFLASRDQAVRTIILFRP